jgi:Icc-related predicted phosphoesterase
MPEGNVLVHAGDLTNMGEGHAIRRFAQWARIVQHKYDDILVIAGNHDFGFENDPLVARGILAEEGPHNLHYLQDDVFKYHDLELDKIFNFYGSPWQPRFYDWAFNVDRGPFIAAKWKMIPDDTHILITHGPPHGILDPGRGDAHVGCEDLLRSITERVRPDVHIFGHCHMGYGRLERDGIVYVNAANCDERHNLSKKPQIISVK